MLEAHIRVGVDRVALLQGESPTNTSYALMLAITLYTPRYQINAQKLEGRGPVYDFVSDGCMNFKFNEYLIGVPSCAS